MGDKRVWFKEREINPIHLVNKNLIILPRKSIRGLVEIKTKSVGKFDLCQKVNKRKSSMFKEQGKNMVVLES